MNVAALKAKQLLALNTFIIIQTWSSVCYNNIFGVSKVLIYIHYGRPGYH